MDFGYKKGHYLFENLNLQLQAGHITGLLGANGAGKTSLLRIIAGTLKIREGNVLVGNKDPFSRHVSSLQQMYCVPEEFDLPAVRVSTYLKASSGFYPSFDSELCHRILDDFDLDIGDKLHELSHGQRKKFLIAFALATRCKLLILDEPTNGLDIPSKSQFRKIVAGSIEDDQLVIISTHQVKDIENLIDNIVVLKDGRVVFQQKTLGISESLSFRTDTKVNEYEALYYESAPGGYKIIEKELNGDPSNIDIELLFNAINSGKELIPQDHE